MCLSREQGPPPYLVGEQVSTKTDPVTVENKYKSFFIQPAREAESARAVTGSRCPHNGKGEDFLSRQRDFFTETAVTPERKVEKSFRRWEINRHDKG